MKPESSNEKLNKKRTVREIERMNNTLYKHRNNTVNNSYSKNLYISHIQIQNWTGEYFLPSAMKLKVPLILKQTAAWYHVWFKF